MRSDFKMEDGIDYESLEKISEDSEETLFLRQNVSIGGRGSKNWSPTVWFKIVFSLILLVVGFSLGCTATYFTLIRRNTMLYNELHASWESGYANEFQAAKSAGVIEITPVRFTSGLNWDKNGTMYRTSSLLGPDYVGAPNPEMDEAWDELVNGRYIAITEAEAAEIGSVSHVDEKATLRHAGVSVLHTLHCLNEIRKDLHTDYYPQPVGESLERRHLHVEHCVDHVRQFIQCHGDLTPLPVSWNPYAELPNADFETIHMCRNFPKLRQWATDRNAEIMAQLTAERKAAEVVNSV